MITPMPKYWYNSKNISGQELSGEYDAADRESVVAMLRQSGYFPLEIKQMPNKDTRVTKRKVSEKSLSVFCSQMATVLKAGVSLPQAFEIMTGQTQDKRFNAILKHVFSKVQGGTGLTEAFMPYAKNFPTLFLSMIEAGEASGTLDVCLERAGESFLRTSRLNSKIRTTLVYPIILITMTVAIVALLMVVVIPLFVTMFEKSGTELPMLTQILVSISHFFTHQWYVLVAAIVIIVIVTRLILSTEQGRTDFDHFKLKAPLVGKTTAKVCAARYARTLSTMSTAGVPIAQALEITARTIGNRYLEKQIYSVVESVKRGEGLSGPVSRMNALPPMIVYMTKLGEESGKLEELLTQAAVFYEDESEASLQTIAALLEPSIIILLAIFVVPIILGIMLPVFKSYTMLM